MFRFNSQNNCRAAWTRLTLFALAAFATAIAPLSAAFGQEREVGVKPLRLAAAKAHINSFTTSGGHTITFHGVEYDFQNPGESTWYYSVTSGSSPNVSHSAFEVGACATIEDAGTWDSPDKTSLNSGDGNPQFGNDPTTGITGVKFDEATAAGQTSYYYFSLDGNYSIDHITAGVKAGSNEELGEINGPSLTCEEPTPDLRIEKTDGGISVDEGTGFAYTLTVFNDGDVDIAEFTLSETVPDNTTFDSGNNSDGWSCSDTAAGGTCTLTGGPLSTGNSVSFEFPLLVDELWVPDPVTGLCGEEPQDPEVDNTGSVSYTGDGDDATPGNNSDSDTTPINVSCTDNPATLTVVKVTDPATEGLTFGFQGSSTEDGFDSFDLTTGGDGTDSQSFTLPGGDYSVAETSLAAGWELESTSCTGGNTVGDISLSPGDEETCTFTNRELDPGIQIVKTDSVASVAEGGSLDYTLTYSNTGELELTGVTITDTVPANTTFNGGGTDAGSWSCSGGEGPGTSCTFNVGTLGIDDDGLTVNFPLTVDELWEPDEETGLCPEEPENPQVNNTGSIVGTSINGNVNDSDNENTPIDVECEDNPATLTVVKVTDPATEGLTFGFEGSSTEDGFDTFDLTTGGDGTDSQSFTLPGGDYSVAETSLEDGWELDSTSCTGGNTVGDISLSPGDEVTCTFTNRELDPGIEIVKTDSTDPVAEGGSLDYTLTYSNTGELDLTNVAITDDVPANTTFNGSGTDAGSWSCSDGDGPGTTCTFNVGTLEVDDDGLTVNFPLTVNGDLWEPDEETGLCGEEPEFQVDNTGNISGTSVNGDVDDSDSESTGIELSCEDNPATLTVVKVTDPATEGLTFGFQGSSTEDGFDSFDLTTGGDGTDSRSFTLPGGDYSVAETSLAEGWALDSTSCTGDNTVGDISLSPGDEETCTFTNRALSAGLSVIKRTNGDEIRENFCDEGTIIVGETVEWTYAVTNTGEQALNITSITDDAGTPGEAGDDFTPTFVDGDANSNGVLDPGETWNYQAGDNAGPGEYSNVVTVEAEVQGSEQQVAAKAEPGTLIQESDSSGYCGVQPDLAIEKTDGDLSFVPEGSDFAYTLSYQNLGSVDVTGVEITETVPEHTTFNAAGPDGGLWTCGDTAAGSACTHEVGALAAGASGSVQFPLTVDELVEPDPDTGQCPTDPPDFVVDNTGSIQDDGQNGEDANPDNNTDSDTTPVLIECDDEQLEPPAIDIVKNPDSQLLEEGGTANFTIVVTNTGPVTLFNVEVTDPQSPDCSRDIGTMEPGAIESYDCERLDVVTKFTNVATVTGDDGEGNDVSDDDTALVNVLTVDEPPQHVNPIPTLSQWALILMAGLMLLLGGRRVRVWTRR